MWFLILLPVLLPCMILAIPEPTLFIHNQTPLQAVYKDVKFINSDKLIYLPHLIQPNDAERIRFFRLSEDKPLSMNISYAFHVPSTYYTKPGPEMTVGSIFIQQTKEKVGQKEYTTTKVQTYGFDFQLPGTFRQFIKVRELYLKKDGITYPHFNITEACELPARFEDNYFYTYNLPNAPYGWTKTPQDPHNSNFFTGFGYSDHCFLMRISTYQEPLLAKELLNPSQPDYLQETLKLIRNCFFSTPDLFDKSIVLDLNTSYNALGYATSEYTFKNPLKDLGELLTLLKVNKVKDCPNNVAIFCKLKYVNATTTECDVQTSLDYGSWMFAHLAVHHTYNNMWCAKFGYGPLLCANSLSHFKGSCGPDMPEIGEPKYCI